jgi:hypothetical protein
MSAVTVQDIGALAVATVQVALVDSVVRAMQTADIAGAKSCEYPGPSARVTLTPDPHYAPRRIIHPEARYLPRPVLHPVARVEPRPCLPEVCPMPPNRPTLLNIQLPWKVLPWQQPAAIHESIKVVHPLPDTQRKGELIDIFI